MLIAERKKCLDESYVALKDQLDKNTPSYRTLHPEIAQNLIKAANVKNNFERDIKKVDYEIKQWKATHISSKEPFELKLDPSERQKVLKKAKLIKTALLVNEVVGMVFGLPNLFHGLLATIFALSMILSIPFLSTPIGPSLLLAEVLALGLGGVSVALSIPALTSALLSKSLVDPECDLSLKILRQATAINDEEFKEFTTCYFPKDGDFSLDENMKSDRKLHSIYDHFKRAISPLPAIQQNVTSA